MLYNLKTGIRIVRGGGPLGLAVERDQRSDVVASSDGSGDCFHVLHVAADGAVASEGSIEPGDKIVELNGASVGGWSLEEFVGRVKAAADPIVFSAVKCNGEHGSLAAMAEEVGKRLDATARGSGESYADDVSSGGGEASVPERSVGELSEASMDGTPPAKPNRVGRLKNMLRGSRNQPAPQTDNTRETAGDAETESMEWLQIRVKANEGQALGAMLSMNKEDGSWFIKGIIDDSPVALEGTMRECDRVERVNGRSIAGLSMDAIRPMLRTRGTVVFLVSRPLHEVSLASPEPKPKALVKPPEVNEEVLALKRQVESLTKELRSKDREVEHLRRALERARRANSNSAPLDRQPETVRARDADHPKQMPTRDTVYFELPAPPPDDDRSSPQQGRHQPEMSASGAKPKETLRDKESSEHTHRNTIWIEARSTTPTPDDDRNDASPSHREERADRDASDDRDTAGEHRERTGSVSPTDFVDPTLPQRWADSVE